MSLSRGPRPTSEDTSAKGVEVAFLVSSAEQATTAVHWGSKEVGEKTAAGRAQV